MNNISAQIHTGKKSSTEDTKKMLNYYKGGSVDLIKQNNGIAHLILNHPERRNALSGSMMVDMADALEELEKWDKGVGLVVRGG